MTDGDREDSTAPESSDSDLRPADVDRVFSILEAALSEPGSLEPPTFDRLVAVLERSIVGSTDPEDVEELLSLLEEAVVEPGDVDDVEGLLSAIEKTLAETPGSNANDVEALFSLIERALADPTGTEPEDVSELVSIVESHVTELTDPDATGFGNWLTDRAWDSDTDSTTPFKLARLTTGMIQRTTGHSVDSSVRAGSKLAYAAAHADSPATLFDEMRAVTLEELRDAGIDVGERRADWLDSYRNQEAAHERTSESSLCERGERLLERSATIGAGETVHPAYTHVLDQLASDEGRILRLLATDGPQPAIDVRDAGVVPFTSKCIAATLTMVGMEAGCRDERLTDSYLYNLHRLGLVWFSDDPVDDLKRYQVLDAQPHVESARTRAKRPKSVHRSVHLTPFGVEFCRVCMPFDVDAERPAGALGSPE